MIQRSDPGLTLSSRINLDVPRGAPSASIPGNGLYSNQERGHFVYVSEEIILWELYCWTPCAVMILVICPAC